MERARPFVLFAPCKRRSRATPGPRTNPHPDHASRFHDFLIHASRMRWPSGTPPQGTALPLSFRDVARLPSGRSRPCSQPVTGPIRPPTGLIPERPQSFRNSPKAIHAPSFPALRECEHAVATIALHAMVRFQDAISRFRLPAPRLAIGRNAPSHQAGP